MHDTSAPHTHDEAGDNQNPAPAPDTATDPKADHEANHKEKVDGCEYC